MNIPILTLRGKKLVSFGYDIDEPITLGDHLVKARLARGISNKKLATILNVEQGTLIAWQKNRREPSERLKKRIDDFFKAINEDKSTF